MLAAGALLLATMAATTYVSAREKWPQPTEAAKREMAEIHLDTNDMALASRELDGDGYTVIEKFLNGLPPGKKIDWKEPKANENTLTAKYFLTAR